MEKLHYNSCLLCGSCIYRQIIALKCTEIPHLFSHFRYYADTNVLIDLFTERVKQRWIEQVTHIHQTEIYVFIIYKQVKINEIIFGISFIRVLNHISWWKGRFADDKILFSR